MIHQLKCFAILLAAIAALSPRLTAAEKNAETSAVRDTTLAPMRDLLERFAVDRQILQRSNRVPMSISQMTTLRRYYGLWLDRIKQVNFEKLNQEGQIDYLLLNNQLRYLLRKQEITAKRDAATFKLVPFARTIVGLAEKQRRMVPINAAKTAKKLNQLAADIRANQAALAKRLAAAKSRSSRPGIDRVTGQRVLQRVQQLHRTLFSWNRFYSGYHPDFSWWNKTPYQDVDAAFRSLIAFVEKRIVHPDPKDKEKLVGLPIGQAALSSELEYEMITYSPSQLIEIAMKEFQWCDREMNKAAKELGFGDDWRKAQQHVKNLYVKPDSNRH